MLNTKQKKFIPEYLKTGCIKSTCKKLKINESTYFKWKENPKFLAELKKQEEILYNDSLDKLRTLFPEAIDTFKNLLKSGNEGIQFRTACAVIDNMVKLLENKELKDRIEAVEEILERENTNNGLKK